MRICRVESVEPGELCRIYGYVHWWQQAESKIEPEEILLRLSSPGKWRRMTDKYKQYEFLRGNKVSIVVLDGSTRVTVV